jgi:hypothetical protein
MVGSVDQLEPDKILLLLDIMVAASHNKNYSSALKGNSAWHNIFSCLFDADLLIFLCRFLISASMFLASRVLTCRYFVLPLDRYSILSSLEDKS